MKVTLLTAPVFVGEGVKVGVEVGVGDIVPVGEGVAVVVGVSVGRLELVGV